MFGTGLAGKINEADITKLSFLIGGIFMYYTIKIGLGHQELNKDGVTQFSPIIKKVKEIAKKTNYVANLLQDIGMFGTVIGFIYMLSVRFGGLEGAGMTALHAALKDMGIGMGTALYTTASGLLCSILLRIQLYPFIRAIESKEE